MNCFIFQYKSRKMTGVIVCRQPIVYDNSNQRKRALVQMLVVAVVTLMTDSLWCLFAVLWDLMVSV